MRSGDWKPLRLARDDPKTFYVREAIHTHLDDLEEHYWADEAITNWENSPKKTRPADALWSELGL